MAGSTLLVVFVAALLCSACTGAALTWSDPVVTADGKSTHTLSVAEGAEDFGTDGLTIAIAGTAVTYTLEGEKEPFAVDEKGVITITGTLDYETKASYTLNVVATEKAEPADGGTKESSTATVTITVTDVVSFSKLKDTVCVPDGAEADVEVTTLPVPSAQSASNGDYTFTAANGADKFKVDGDKILVKTTLDMKTAASYTLKVKAANKPDELELTVTVGECSAASLLTPLGLLTLLMALVVSMN